MCHMSRAACHLSLTPTAPTTDPPPANYPVIHSKLVCKDQKTERYTLCPKVSRYSYILMSVYQTVTCVAPSQPPAWPPWAPPQRTAGRHCWNQTCKYTSGCFTFHFFIWRIWKHCHLKSRKKTWISLKREAGNPILNTLRNTTSAIFSACKKPAGVPAGTPAYNLSFEYLIWTYNCRKIPVGLLHAEKMDKAASVNVFRIGFPASLFGGRVKYLTDPV